MLPVVGRAEIPGKEDRSCRSPRRAWACGVDTDWRKREHRLDYACPRATNGSIMAGGFVNRIEGAPKALTTPSRHAHARVGPDPPTLQ